MSRWLTWLMLAASFVALAAMSQQAPARPTHWLTGQELTNNLYKPEHHTTQLVGIRGTTESVEAKTTGTRVIKIQADDGSPVTIVVPAHITVALPHVGERVEAQGSQLDLGVVTLEAPQLRRLSPEYGDKPSSLSTYQRTTQYVCLKLLQELPGGAKLYSVEHADGQYIITGVAPARLQLSNPTLCGEVTGYVDTKNELIIEGVN